MRYHVECFSEAQESGDRRISGAQVQHEVINKHERVLLTHVDTSVSVYMNSTELGRTGLSN